MSSAARSQADDLRGRTDEMLVALLMHRPDLARPAPTDLTSLAARVGTAASTQGAIDRLTRGQLDVLKAVTVAPPNATAAHIADLLGAPKPRVDALLDELWERALVWGSAQHPRASRAVHQILDPYADRLESSPARPAADRTPITAVAASLDPPAVTVNQVDLTQVDAAGAGRILQLLESIEVLIEAWDESPPRLLLAGGLSVRDLSSLARVVNLPVDVAGFVAELAVMGRLIADDEQVDPSWRPTVHAMDDSARPAEERWVELATAWWSSTRAPHLIGRTVAGSRVNALGPKVQWPPIRSIRQDVLQVLASLKPGSSMTAADLKRTLIWRRPRRLPASSAAVDDVVRAIISEADALGLISHGALTNPGRALVDHLSRVPDADADGHDGENPAVAVAAAALPASVTTVILQGDLTAVAPGPAIGDLARLLRLVADRESTGAASVYRFTAESVRRALDTGWDAEALIGRLRQVSSTDLPQPLDYLIRDTARRHGVARVGSAGAYLRSDDTALLDEIVTARSLSPLGLVRIAPTVAISRVDPTTMLHLLRDAGYAPVADSDGSAGLLPPRTPKRVGAARPAVTRRRLTITEAGSLVKALRRGDERAEAAQAQARAEGRPALAVADPTTTMALVRDAIADNVPVWVAHVDRFGDTEHLLLHPQRLDGGRVIGTVDGVARSLSVHRISGAAQP
ncbi:MAG: helicase-associated domain-containing protein [Nostocoides sp.]